MARSGFMELNHPQSRFWLRSNGVLASYLPLVRQQVGRKLATQRGKSPAKFHQSSTQPHALGHSWRKIARRLGTSSRTASRAGKIPPRFRPLQVLYLRTRVRPGHKQTFWKVTRKRARGLGRNRPDLYLTGLDLAEGAVQLQARWSLQRVSAFSFPSSRCRALAAESAGVFPSVLALPISFSDARSSVSQMGRCIGQDFLSPAYPEAKAQGGLVPPETELGVTLRSDDAAETPPATETNHYFRLWAVPPVE